MLCVTPKIHGALGDSAVAESAPQTFALLPHLSKDPVLQTGSCRCTPNSRLFIMHCHRTGSFPSYTPTNTTHPPTFASPRPPMLLLALHLIAALRYQSTAMRLAPSLSSFQTTLRCPCPDTTPQQRWPGCHAGRTGGRMDRQAGRQTRGHVISV